MAACGLLATATGPHVHYAIMENGEKINPQDAKVPVGGTQLTGRELTAVRAEKSRIDGMISRAQTMDQTRIATEAAPASVVKTVANGAAAHYFIRR